MAERGKAMNRLKELRKEKGVSLKKLSTAIGVKDNTLSQYETGKRQPRDMAVWERLSDYFDVIPEYLLGYTTIRTKEDRDRGERCVEYWRWREKRQ